MWMWWQIAALFLVLVLLVGAQLWCLGLIAHMRRQQNITYRLMRVWAELWGQPSDDVKAALNRILPPNGS